MTATAPRQHHIGTRVPQLGSDPTDTSDWRDPRYQAFALLRFGYAVAPIAFGLDKFLNVLVYWPKYLAP
jgi:hypothetical protein